MPETDKRPLKVFLCHASQDKPIVRELTQRLFAEGWIDPWLDEKKLLPGQDWRLKIEEAVETSDIVVICLSNNSISKEGFVQKELRYAREIALEKLEESIFLIPLRLDDCNVPRGLRFYQWSDYFGEKKDETYSVLLESLKIRYEQKLRIDEELASRDKQRQEPSTVEMPKAHQVNPNQKQLLPADISAGEMMKGNDITELFLRIDKQITEKYFPYVLIICMILSAIIGGLLWNVLNVLLNWTFHLGGSGSEPHGFQAFIWGVVSFLPVLFFVGLAGYRYILSKHESLGKLGIVIMLYTIFAGLGAVVFYDLGFRNYVESLRLGYGAQELIIVSIWAFVISSSISLPLLVFSRFTTILNARYIFLQISLPVVLAFLAIIASLFIPRPENEIAQLRGFFAAVALRIGLFIGMYLSISRNSRKLR